MLLLIGCAPTPPVKEPPSDDTGCVATMWYRDGDGDGVGDVSRGATSACEAPTGYAAAQGDCDDADPAVLPDAAEDCDGQDDDCDGEIDESAQDASAWYADGDGDGFGAGEAVAACDAPPGFVANADDCDDADAEVSPDGEEVCGGGDEDCDGDTTDGLDAATWYADGDGDGFGDAASSVDACEAPAGFVADDADCDDANATISPGATESCNGVDDDCDDAVDEGAPPDADTWYADTDGDGFGDPSASILRCDAPSGYVADATDCDDTSASISPSGIERCDGTDEDCDGEIDEDATDAATWYADVDGDGYGDAATQVFACDVPPGYVADPSDCDDTSASVSPVATETCDGTDQDCDGTVDESASDAATWYADTDGDGYGDPASASTACEAPPGYLSDATDCDDTSADIHPGAEETCASPADDDCDGTVDEDPIDGTTWYADADIDGRGDPDVSVVACTRPYGYLADDTDCDDADADAHPGAAESCSPGDDDCDGLVDESVPDCDRFYVDADGDGAGGAAFDCLCAASAAYPATTDDDCDDTDADQYPGNPEVWDDDVDQDCDGSADRSSLTDFAWDILGGTAAGLGYALAGPGDLDGDGLGDLVVGAPEDGGGLGAVYWFQSVAEGAAVADAEVFTGITAGDAVGQALATGDLDGDGATDLLIGGEDHQVSTGAGGAAWVFSDLAAGGRSIAAADILVEGGGNDGLGATVAVLGDLDGDGVEEWAAGAPSNDAADVNAGIVFVFSGAATAPSDAGWVLQGRAGNAALGDHGLAGLGDVDGDGLGDFAVGGVYDGSPAIGSAYVFLGASGAVTGAVDAVADVEITGTRAVYRLGAELVGGHDCDGDGLDDLVAAATGWTEPGEIYVITDVSNAADIADAWATWRGGAHYGYFGTAVSWGDVDGDATDDLLVTEPYRGAALGGGHVLSGCASGSYTLSDASFTMLGERSSDTGRSVAFLGDTDGDGMGDFAIGAPSQDSGDGAVWVVTGR